MIGALVGLTESTLTLRVLDEMTNTRGQTNKEYFAQGLANTINGFFGGMGGDAMIGQSIVNVQAGGRSRLSAFVAASALLLFLLLAAPVVNSIPLAALVGLMFMVVVYTFKWETLNYWKKIPAHDLLVIAVVSVVTIFLNLATAVIVGVLLSTIMFAWERGKQLEVKVQTNHRGEKIYKINGILFFGSISSFRELFDVEQDPQEIVIDLKYAKIADTSAIEGINAIAEKYEQAGKHCIVTRASENCRALLKNAEDLTKIKVNHSYDPTG